MKQQAAWGGAPPGATQTASAQQLKSAHAAAAFARIPQ